MKWGVVLGVLLLSPLYALAAGTSFFGPIVPACTEYGGAVPICQACNLIQLADNLIRFFISLAVMTAALMFAYAGFLYVSASSNKQNIDSARKIFTNVFIGLVLVLAAFLIIDMVLRVLTGSSLNVLTKIQCVKMETTTGSIKYTVVPGDNNVQGTQGEQQTRESTGTPTGFGSTCNTGGTLGDAIGKIDGTTHYNPGGGGDAGPDVDAFNGTPYTVSECKAEARVGAGGCNVCSKPITVALPQDVKLDCKVKGGDLVTWDEYSSRNNLCQGTKFILSDSYGCYKERPTARYDGVNPCTLGRTSTGYSVDVAACAPNRPGAQCFPVKDARGLPPPKPIPPGG